MSYCIFLKLKMMILVCLIVIYLKGGRLIYYYITVVKGSLGIAEKISLQFLFTLLHSGKKLANQAVRYLVSS